MNKGKRQNVPGWVAILRRNPGTRETHRSCVSLWPLDSSPKSPPTRVHFGVFLYFPYIFHFPAPHPSGQGRAWAETTPDRHPPGRFLSLSGAYTLTSLWFPMKKFGVGFHIFHSGYSRGCISSPWIPWREVDLQSFICRETIILELSLCRPRLAGQAQVRNTYKNMEKQYFLQERSIPEMVARAKTFKFSSGLLAARLLILLIFPILFGMCTNPLLAVFARANEFAVFQWLKAYTAPHE